MIQVHVEHVRAFVFTTVTDGVCAEGGGDLFSTLGFGSDGSGGFSICVRADRGAGGWEVFPVSLEALQKFVLRGTLRVRGLKVRVQKRARHLYVCREGTPGGYDRNTAIPVLSLRLKHRGFCKLELISSSGGWGQTDLELFRELVARGLGLQIPPGSQGCSFLAWIKSVLWPNRFVRKVLILR